MHWLVGRTADLAVSQAVRCQEPQDTLTGDTPKHRPLRMAAINFLNPAPLMWDFEHEPGRSRLRVRYEIGYTTPSRCADELAAGEADIGLVPIAAYATTPSLLVVPGLHRGRAGPGAFHYPGRASAAGRKRGANGRDRHFFANLLRLHPHPVRHLLEGPGGVCSARSLILNRCSRSPMRLC